MNIYDMTRQQLTKKLEEHNIKKFVSDQIFDWIYVKNISSFDLMSNINKNNIKILQDNFNFEELSIIKKQTDTDVIKYLFRLSDGNVIESVLMNHNYGYSLCISTQVGCNMACAFCESGKLKKVRNLNTSEMVLQILKIENDINTRISSIVLMGIGEPLDNYDNVINFINIITDNKGLNKGVRHITLSTCGIIPKINKLLEDEVKINLAISLHASNDDTRKKLMPINKVYNMHDLINCIKNYIKITNKRVAIEYILIKGINDSNKDAYELSNLFKGINIYINLIPYNENTSEFKKSSKVQILQFYDILKKNNIDVTIRREFGNNIDGACGQLRGKYGEEA